MIGEGQSCFQGPLSQDPGSTSDGGQTREIRKNQEKYFKGKVVTFTVQSLILNQYPVDLLTLLELY